MARGTVARYDRIPQSEEEAVIDGRGSAACETLWRGCSACTCTTLAGGLFLGNLVLTAHSMRARTSPELAFKRVPDIYEVRLTPPSLCALLIPCGPLVNFTHGDLFVQAPTKAWPQNMTRLGAAEESHRRNYYMSEIVDGLFLAVVLATALALVRNLMVSKRPSVASCLAEAMVLKGLPSWSWMAAWWCHACLAMALLTYCSAVTGVEHQAGLPWEAWCAWCRYHFVSVVCQALLLFTRGGGPVRVLSVATAVIFTLVPYLSEPFDLFGDLLFAFKCVAKGDIFGYILGTAAFLHLFVTQLLFMRWTETSAEIRSAYCGIYYSDLNLTPERGEAPSALTYQEWMSGKLTNIATLAKLQAVELVFKQTSPGKQAIGRYENLFQGVLKVLFSAKYGGDPFVLFTILLDICRCTIAPLIIDTVVEAHEPKILERLFNAAQAGDVPVVKEIGELISGLEETKQKVRRSVWEWKSQGGDPEREAASLLLAHVHLGFHPGIGDSTIWVITCLLHLPEPGLVLCGGNSGKVAALDPRTGERAWGPTDAGVTGERAWGPTRACVSSVYCLLHLPEPGLVLCGGSSGKVTALDPRTGELTQQPTNTMWTPTEVDCLLHLPEPGLVLCGGGSREVALMDQSFFDHAPRTGWRLEEYGRE